MKLFWLCFSLTLTLTAQMPKDDGYRGIWYYNQASNDEYGFKYSGGFATYPQQQLPIAYYSKEANKTFFCYGGCRREANELMHMVSYYDHATGQVPRPTILVNKGTADAHDNPVLMLDDAGYVWVFSNSHGTARDAYIFKSKKPYSVDDFDRVVTTNFSYGQPWYLSGFGFFFLHTHYQSNTRILYWMTSPDGVTWSGRQELSHIEMGHYQVSQRDGTRVATMFNYHPKPLGLNARTNLYYLETKDQGKTWTDVRGEKVDIPISTIDNPALVHDYRAEHLLVYLKDLQFDAQRRPVLMYLTSKGYASGPSNDPRIWYTARWTGKDWDIRRITTSDHNYDFGSLYIEDGGVWRIIAATGPGPQPYTTGGEIVMWISKDQGATWTKLKQLTHDSHYNQTYPRRPVNAHPDFYALWADGDPRQISESHLYFTNRDGTHVWQLPSYMKGNMERPQSLQ